MITEIKAVEINSDEIRITGIDLEGLLTQDDLYEDAECEEVVFVFPRDEKRISSMKYLYKVTSSQKKCKDAKNMGERLDKLIGSIISLSENFIER